MAGNLPERPPSHPIRAPGFAESPILTALGLIIMAFGLLMCLGAVTQLGEPEHDLAANLVGFIIAGLGPATLGGTLALKSTRARRRLHEERLERQLFAAARAHDWSLTPVDVAADTDLTLSEAQAALDRLTSEGHAQLDITDGSLIYRFHRAHTEAGQGIDRLEAELRRLESEVESVDDPDAVPTESS